MIPELPEILAAFSISPDSDVRLLGNGNINATYFVDAVPEPFVLQKISEDVFPDPVAVIENFEIIYNHLAGRVTVDSGDFIMASPVYTKNDSVCFVDCSGGHWRAQRYLETRRVLAIESQKQAQSIGETLANFHHLFKDLHLAKIKDPLPGFHHLLLYLEAYDTHLGNEVEDYENSLLFCHSIIEKFRDKACTIEMARQRGKVVPQPVHGDPKLDNFIFDSVGKARGLLDLDTVGAGLIYHDLGDCLRSACSTSGESAADSRPPGFDINCCEWIVAGYLSADPTNTRDLRPELIYDGLMAICFELGVRFLTDHLQGNVYFKTVEDGQNLIRAKKQFQLFQEVIEVESSIRKMIDTLFQNIA